jgi:WD40 repeat protein
LLVVATVSALVAHRNSVAATKNEARANQQHALALSRVLASQSRLTRDRSWVTSQRLAAAALHVAPTDEAADAASALLADYRHIAGHSAGVSAVAFSPDGHRLATASEGDSVRLWDMDTGKPIDGPLTGRVGPNGVLTFSPDGKRLLSSGFMEMLTWDAATGKPVTTPLTDSKDVGDANVTLSMDGALVATSSTDGKVQLWDTNTGEPVGLLRTGYRRGVAVGALSPLGRLLVADGGNGEVRIWDTDKGTPVGLPSPATSAH